MMPVQTARPREPRGLHCPKCRAALDCQKVAKSYASPAGQYRLRWCGQCHSPVETSEVVVGLEPEVLDVSDLNEEQVKLVRMQVEVLRSSNRQLAEAAA